MVKLTKYTRRYIEMEGRRGDTIIVIMITIAFISYSPSLKNLMIVTESVTRGAKFVFNTSQVKK